MMELQIKFLGQFTLEFLTEIHTPLLQIRNPKWQNNKVPSEVKIFEGADQGMIHKAIMKASMVNGWLAREFCCAFLNNH